MYSFRTISSSKFITGLILGGQNLGKESQTVFCTTLNHMNKEHKDPYETDLTAPRLAWFKQKTWKRHQDTVYWVDIQLGQRKGLKFYQTKSNAIIPLRYTPSLLYPEGYHDGKWRSHIGKSTCVTSAEGAQRNQHWAQSSSSSSSWWSWQGSWWTPYSYESHHGDEPSTDRTGWLVIQVFGNKSSGHDFLEFVYFVTDGSFCSWRRSTVTDWVCKYHTSNDMFSRCKKCAQNGYREKWRWIATAWQQVENLNTKWKIHKSGKSRNIYGSVTKHNANANDNIYDCVVLHDTDTNDNTYDCVALHDAYTTDYFHWTWVRISSCLSA